MIDNTPITLDEACLRLSRTYPPEAIAAFRHVELQAGYESDTEMNYRRRFVALMQTPA